MSVFDFFVQLWCQPEDPRRRRASGRLQVPFREEDNHAVLAILNAEPSRTSSRPPHGPTSTRATLHHRPSRSTTAVTASPTTPL